MIAGYEKPCISLPEKARFSACVVTNGKHGKPIALVEICPRLTSEANWVSGASRSGEELNVAFSESTKSRGNVPIEIRIYNCGSKRIKAMVIDPDNVEKPYINILNILTTSETNRGSYTIVNLHEAFGKRLMWDPVAADIRNGRRFESQIKKGDREDVREFAARSESRSEEKTEKADPIISYSSDDSSSSFHDFPRRRKRRGEHVRERKHEYVHERECRRDSPRKYARVREDGESGSVGSGNMKDCLPTRIMRPCKDDRNYYVRRLVVRIFTEQEGTEMIWTKLDNKPIPYKRDNGMRKKVDPFIMHGVAVDTRFNSSSYKPKGNYVRRYDMDRNEIFYIPTTEKQEFLSASVVREKVINFC